MGLFSGLFGSTNHAQTTTTTTGATTNTQLAGGDVSAPVNWGSGTQNVKVTNTTIDAGALAAATQMNAANDALAAVGIVTNANLVSNISTQAIGAASSLTSAAVNMNAANDALAAIGIVTNANLNAGLAAGSNQLASQVIASASDMSGAASSLGMYGIASGVAVANAGLDNARAASQGALSFADNIVSNALDTSGQSSDRIARFAGAALDANSTFAGNALDVTADSANESLAAAIDFAHSALGSQSDLAKTAVGAVSDSTSGVLDWARGIFNTAINSQATLTNQNTAAVSGLASQVSQSAQQSTNEATQKVVLYVAMAVAAVFIFRKGSA
jgi:hypothetical protein